VLLPIIAGAAEGAAGLAQAFGSLPEPVKGALTVLGGVGGVAALGAGAFLTLTPKVLESMEAFNKLAPAGGRARGALVGVGKAAGAAMALATVTTVLAKLAESDYMSKIDTGMGKVADVLADVTANSPGAAASLDSLFKDRDGGNLIQGVEDLNTAMQRTFNKNKDQEFNDWAEGIIGAITPVKGSSHILADSFDRIDQSLADMVSSGKPEDAAKVFAKIEAAAKIQGATVEELAAKFPQYGDALRGASADAKNAAADGDAVAGSIKGAGEAASGATPMTEEVAEALADVGVNADGAAVDLVKFTDALLNAGLMELSARDAARGFEEAIDNVTTAVTTNGQTLDITTEAGRNNQAALDGIASAGLQVVKANAANGESQKTLQGNLKGTYDGLVAAGIQFGLTDDEAIALARDILKVPPKVNINSWMSSEAKRMAQDTKAAADAVDGRVVDVYVNTHRTETTLQKVIREITEIGGKKVTGEGTVLLPRKAAGGPIDGPGPKGVDSELILAAPGEHMLTAREVDIMGGHDAVYRFRNNVRTGNYQALAGGGAVGSMAAASQIMVNNHAAAAAAPVVTAPDVRVFIGNEQIDARIEVVAGGVVQSADAQSKYMRKGR
jgi:sulfur carrier protein ThiS